MNDVVTGIVQEVETLSGVISGVEKMTGNLIPTGPAGKSAYEYAVEGGYIGTEAQFYKDLAHVGESTAGILFIKSFRAEDFSASGIRYVLPVPANEHNLGYSAIIRDVLRKSDSGYGNIWYQGKALPNGDIAVYTHDPFSGKITIEKVQVD